MIPKSCRLFGQDHTTKQVIRAKWRFDTILFRSRASDAWRRRVLEFSLIVSPMGEGAIGREVAMKRLISAVCFLSALGMGAASAQPFTPNDAGITMGHWHLNSANAEANKKIFVAMGGTDTSIGPSQRVTFPGVIVIMNLGAPGPAP